MNLWFHHEPFARGPLQGIPESTCYSAICPLKLGHTAESIVNSLLCEFGLESESKVFTGCDEKGKHPRCRKTSGLPEFTESKQLRQKKNDSMEELTKSGVRILQRAEEKVYFPVVDKRTINKIVDSILREFAFQFTADRDMGRDIETLSVRAAEIILTEILDYQLPPPLCRRLPQTAYQNVRAEYIIQRVEHSVCFPKVRRHRPSPPEYITVLSQKYLEKVINQLVTQLFPYSEGPTQKQEKREFSNVEINDLCSYMISRVMTSISKHKIWVAKKDDHFIIQEITNHHLQTFLSKEEVPSGCLDTEALSEKIVGTVLDSLGEPFSSHVGVFPAKFLQEIVSRVLSKIFCVSSNKKEDYITTEISAHEIKLENISERVPAIDQETEEDIARSIYNQLLQKSNSQRELQESLKDHRNSTVYDIVHLLIREILNFHFQPFLNDSNSSVSGGIKWKKEKQPFSRRIYSAVLLEDVVVAFLCKILSSPNMLTYSKDTNLSQHKLKDLVIKLVNALVNELKILHVKVIQCAKEEGWSLPHVGAEKVVQISSSIYVKLLQLLGSEFEIFRTFQTNGQILAEKLAPLIIREISQYQFFDLISLQSKGLSKSQ
uniref:Fibrous sheath-interacting protein 2 C-terminal domain-containing protein n=1 Tax=Salvator merianae TaxID=96440 RepID=A0A8D0E6H2_SALMN